MLPATLPRIPTDNVAVHIQKLLKTTGVSASMLAQVIAIPEAQLNRMSRNKSSVRPKTLRPIERAETLVQEALKTFTPAGVKHWLQEPNPYLNDVPPLLC